MSLPVHLIADIEPLFLDPEPAIHHCLRRALASLDLPAPDDLSWVRHFPFMDAAMTLIDQAGGRPDDLDRFCGAYQRAFACQGRLRSGVRHDAVAATGLVTGAACHSHDGRCCAGAHGGRNGDHGQSSAKMQPGIHYLTHIGQPDAQALVAHHALLGSIGSIFTSRAPQPRIVRPAMLQGLVEALRRAGDDETWVLSDDPAELTQAAALGCQTVGLGYARVAPEHIARAKPDVMVYRPNELTATLQLLAADTELVH